MGRFGPDPRGFFESVYRETAPWDVGFAQPALAELFDAYPPATPVLDVGCGTGDLSIAIARRGLTVLGLDFAEGAISQAAAKRDALPTTVAEQLTFQVGDALRPSLLGRTFGAVVDTGFMHLFEHDMRDAFAAELARVLRAGGRYYVLAFAVSYPNGPLKASEAELRDRFASERGWIVRACSTAHFETRVGNVPAIRACVERI